MNDEQRVTKALRASMVVRAVDRMASLAVSAWRSSVTLSRGREMYSRCADRTRGGRQAQAGVALVAAAVTHVAMAGANGEVHGWMWLLLPGVMFSSGVVAIASGRARSGAEHQGGA